MNRVELNSKWISILILTIFALLVAAPQTGQSFASLAVVQGTPHTFVEDFTSDTNPAMGGFASSRFVHTTSGNFSFANEADLPTVAPFPSSPHAMFRFTGSDEVTFGLSPGETVTRAKVSVNSLYGEAHVTFVGSSDSKNFMFMQGQQPWQSVEVHPTDLGDGGFAIGDIRRITLVGFEGLFDNVEIDVAGSPTPTFDVCLQDESNGNLLRLNSATGDYLFVSCRGGFTVAGTGRVTIRGSMITFQHNAPDRNVLAMIDNAARRGTASLQLLSMGMTLTIADRNTANNGCTC